MDSTQTPNQDEKHAQNGSERELDGILQVNGRSNAPTGLVTPLPALTPVELLNKCKFCGKPVKEMFCSKNCGQKYYYHNDERVRTRVKETTKRCRRERIERDPSLKALNVKKFKEWREKNRDRHNAQMREIQRKKFLEVRGKGLCYLCRVVQSTECYCPDCKLKRKQQKEKSYAV